MIPIVGTRQDFPVLTVVRAVWSTGPSRQSSAEIPVTEPVVIAACPEDDRNSGMEDVPFSPDFAPHSSAPAAAGRSRFKLGCERRMPRLAHTTVEQPLS